MPTLCVEIPRTNHKTETKRRHLHRWDYRKVQAFRVLNLVFYSSLARHTFRSDRKTKQNWRLFKALFAYTTNKHSNATSLAIYTYWGMMPDNKCSFRGGLKWTPAHSITTRKSREAGAVSSLYHNYCSARSSEETCAYTQHTYLHSTTRMVGPVVYQVS